jgi:hypothetical protein
LPQLQQQMQLKARCRLPALQRCRCWWQLLPAPPDCLWLPWLLALLLLGWGVVAQARARS